MENCYFVEIIDNMFFVRNYSPFLVLMVLLMGGTGNSFAHTVGANFFLQGMYSEIDQLNDGAFGASTSTACFNNSSHRPGMVSDLAALRDCAIVRHVEYKRHRQLVSERGAGSCLIAYLRLGTKDSRACCFIYNYLPFSTARDLVNVWDGTNMITINGLGHSRNVDMAIATTYNIDCAFSHC